MIDIAINKLGIPWEGLSYKLIQKFFESPQIEDDQLEFKSYKDKTLDEWCKDLSKELSAFLNSSGGILVWGAPRETKEKGIKICRGVLTNVPDYDTDDLLRRIGGKIKEIPRGIRVRKLSNSVNYIYIFQVELSEYRPHQNDDRYFMRVNAESRPAPHHYIEALMKRVRYPNLHGSLEFKTISYSNGNDGFNPSWVRVDLLVILENTTPFQNEESPKLIIYCDQGRPINWHEDWPPPEKNRLHLAHANNQLEIIHYGEKFQRRYALGFSYHNLKSEGFQISVVLKFGGRYSPLKLSSYKLDLSILNSNVHIENEKYPIPKEAVKGKENVLISDSEFNMDDLNFWESIEN